MEINMYDDFEYTKLFQYNFLKIKFDNEKEMIKNIILCNDHEVLQRFERET